MPTIEVCQAGTCRAAGGEAVLKEIEELADGTGCSVNPTGCVGACNQAPNAVLVQRGQEYLQTKIDTVEKSAALVEKACGVKPNLDDPALRQRLTAAPVEPHAVGPRHLERARVAELADETVEVGECEGVRLCRLHPCPMLVLAVFPAVNDR